MIKLSIPHLAGNEQKYVAQAIESTWIVPLGPWVDEFERRLDSYLGHGNTVALSAGTAAIHLGLVMAGVKAGDEVADEIAVEFGNYLGHALANIAVVCDPTVFVIGGGVSKAGEILFKYIEKAYY